MKKKDQKTSKNFQSKTLTPFQLKAIKGGTGDSSNQSSSQDVIIIQDVVDG